MFLFYLVCTIILLHCHWNCLWPFSHPGNPTKMFPPFNLFSINLIHQCTYSFDLTIRALSLFSTKFCKPLMEINLVINPGLDFLFAKLTSISLTLEDIQPFDPKYALRSLRILNWAQLEMRTSSISKLMKSKGQPKMGIHIVFRKYMYFRQTGSRMKTSQCEIFFSWAKTRNAFYSNCRTFAHPSSDLGVASWIQIERTTQPAKQ